MDISNLVEWIYKKGKQKEMIDILVSLLPKLNGEVKDKLSYELEAIAYSFSPEEAKTTVQKMTPYGEHWTIDKIKSLLETKDVKSCKLIHYYLVMNMMYNDYYKTAEHYANKEDVDFYFCLSKEFIEDPDGVNFKVEKYFRM